jgi:hypothetical protein
MKVNIDYTNYRGERRTREISIGKCFIGERKMHLSACAMIEALDTERDVTRTFEIRRIHELIIPKDDTVPCDMSNFILSAQNKDNLELYYFPVKCQTQAQAITLVERLCSPSLNDMGNTDDTPFSAKITMVAGELTLKPSNGVL